ncbi:hypothetical protein Natpe_4378 (plasmid) [Natrinema pellirubrum DSM 15624]|uniref:Uncharacterized protein n=1 Tax=Natrinema pellirubrum (strain DSM 15624 / CIP 106293 / JCM 10476 / NCIMB 786 / 157) TaxID=797303 RepID=L0JTD7_NATP1|nr:hypothetical protein [Natrinema pellirubrum]AGB34073.1 hypothetical protein Natpe_4378 [Natrinema pellirubrum DSM 15624]
MSAFAVSFIAGLILVGAERGSEWAHSWINDLDRLAEYSVDLEDVETEFQRALETQLIDRVDDERAEPLTNALEPWDSFVHDLYGLETAVTEPDELASAEHEWMTTQTEREAIEAILDTWVARVDSQITEPVPRKHMRSALVDAYRTAMREYETAVAGTDLADEALLASVRDLRERLASLPNDRAGLNVYKSLSEFERVTALFDTRPEYVPMPAVRESEPPRRERLPDRVADARAELLRLLEGGTDVVTVSGDGGAGKSRLLAATGQMLDAQSDCEVFFVNTPEPEPLPADRDVVLFIDDAGRLDMDYFIRQAVEEHRDESTRDVDVQVVAATRSAYERSVSRFVDGLGSVTTRTLWVNPPTERSLVQLLEPYDTDEEIAAQIVQQADGNPFFVLLLAKLAADTEADPLTLERALSNVVGEMTSTEGDLQRVAEVDPAQVVERLLKWIAVHYEYVEPSDESLLTDDLPALDSGLARRDQLDSLTDAGYLDRKGKATDPEFTYTHRYDVVADFLRIKVLDAQQFRTYARSDTVQRKATEVARGIADLESSPLLDLYPEVRETIHAVSGQLASEIANADLPLNTILDAERYLMAVAPSAVPIAELRAKVVGGLRSDSLGDHAFRFAGRLLHEVGDGVSVDEATEWVTHMGILADEGELSTAEYGQVLSHAVRNYGAIGALEAVDDVVATIQNLPRENTSPEFAVALGNAANIYARARAFDRVETTLAELRVLDDHYHDDKTCDALAMGLMNAAGGYGAVGEFEQVERIRSEVDTLYRARPETDTARYYGMLLANAIADYGNRDQFDSVTRYRSELDSLAESESTPALRREYAIGLYNAVSHYARDENFEQATEVVSELEDLYASSDEATVRDELADALAELTAYVGTDHRTRAEHVCSKLQELYDATSDGAVAEATAKAIANTIEVYRRTEQWDNLNAALDDVRRLYGDFPNTEIARILSRALLAAIASYAKTTEWEQVDETLTELDDLHTSHPTESVREDLVGGLLYATEASLKAGCVDEVDDYLSDLRALGEAHGDLSTLVGSDRFQGSMRELVAASLRVDPNTTAAVLNLLPEVCDGSALIATRTECERAVYEAVEHDEISTATYRRLLDYL